MLSVAYPQKSNTSDINTEPAFHRNMKIKLLNLLISRDFFQ